MAQQPQLAPGPPPTGGYIAGHASPEDSSSPGLLPLLRLLRRRAGTVGMVALIGLLAALLVTLPQTPVYRARASLEIQDLNENFLNIKEVTPVTESGGYAASSDIQTQMKILQSDSLTGRVLARLNARKTGGPKVEIGRLAAWRNVLHLSGAPPETAHGEAIRMAAGNLKVRTAGQTRIVEILCESTDPKIAAEFANTLTDEFIDQNMEARWKMSQRTGEWLTRQLDDMRIRLERSEDGLQSYARQSGLMFTSEKTNLAEEKLRQIQEELSRAQGERAVRQSRYETARAASPDSVPEDTRNTAVFEYQTKLAELRREQAALAATYTPEYARAKRGEAQIASLEETLRRERAAILDRIRNQYSEAARRETLLASDYASQAKLVTEQAGKGIQYNILKREVDSNRQLYESMLQQVRQTAIAAAMRSSNVRVVDPALPPQKPVRPRVLANSALGALTGLFAGVTFIVARERADRSLQRRGEIPLYLQAPELGLIPSAGFEDVELATWRGKHATVAESFHAVLDSILFSSTGRERPGVILVASGSAGEGKTTVASNLAIALAEIGQRVLLIDGDLRKPRMHEIFDLPNEGGLSTLLQQRPLPPDVHHLTVQGTFVPGLFVLSSGPSASSAANLLHSANLGELIRRFRREFDMVFIDSPPMLHLPDARVLGRVADSVILVARAGRTTRDAAIDALRRFTGGGAPVLGVVLNRWNS